MKNWVLLVEDSQDEILLARRAFAKAGLKECLRVAENDRPPEAQLQDADGDTPALVLLDLQMPGRDGLSVLRSLRAISTAAVVPIVILSSSDEPRDIADAYTAGANSYLRKPLDFDRFVQMVRDLHGYWIGHNTLPPERGAA
ncbi:MAG: response regulator [Proteobacteria bacterium]|nr:response regulator [Pseudomonadota bacterium]